MKFSEVVFLEVEDVHELHQDALTEWGGIDGVHDIGLIVSATMQPRTGYYRSLAEMAAAYVRGFAKNHGYNEGNKRTAALVLRVFLNANQLKVSMGAEWEFYVEAFAAGAMSYAELLDEIIALMGGDPLELEEE